MVLIYPDNSVLQSIMRNSKVHDLLYDWSVREFGISWEFIQSNYLFLEYIGFHKSHLEIPKSLLLITPPSDFKNIKSITPKNIKDHEVVQLDGIYVAHFKILQSHIKEKLLKLEDTIKKLYKNTELKSPNNERLGASSNNLAHACFGQIIALLNTDFPEFVENLSLDLAWDVFCGISIKNLDVATQRYRQFVFWLYELYDQYKIVFPFAKIIDDLFKNHDIYLKNYEDMVDAELLTYAILGRPVQLEQNKPVVALTYDDPIKMKNRKDLGVKIVFEFEKRLKTIIRKSSGKIYCLDRENQGILEIIDISVPICI